MSDTTTKSSENKNELAWFCIGFGLASCFTWVALQTPLFIPAASLVTGVFAFALLGIITKGENLSLFGAGVFIVIAALSLPLKLAEIITPLTTGLTTVICFSLAYAYYSKPATPPAE